MVCALILLLSGCGGSSGDSPNSPLISDSREQTWQQGVFVNKDTLAGRCELPRSGTNAQGQSFPDRAGSDLHEKLWLRSWSNDFYLWYDEIEDVDPNELSVPAYFAQLKTNELTELGSEKDNFHFSVDTATYNQSQSGISSGYGMDLVIERTSNTSLTLLVSDVEVDTPASMNNITRGTQILFIDDIDLNNFTNDDIDAINSALSPNVLDQNQTFTIIDTNSDEPRSVTLTSTIAINDPVKFVTTFETETSKAGYLLFNSHNEISEKQLFDAMTELKSQNVSELILDVRYNGGGLLAIASQLSYMIAGREKTENRTFERLAFNDKFPTTNPVTGQRIEPIPFFSTGIGFSLEAATPLPTLDLDRVFIITTANSCSASEAVINSLRGIDVDVILMGSQTCGKPYGFYPTDNCGTTYFTIQFQGVNDKGFGDYPNGFSPSDNELITNGIPVPGCTTEDDFNNELGSKDEASIASALHYIEQGSCPITDNNESLSKASIEPSANSSLTKTLERAKPRTRTLINIPEWQKNRLLEGAF